MSTPASLNASAHCKPVRMLISCSFDGPPKTTAVWLKFLPSVCCLPPKRMRSWQVIREIVLVDDDVARTHSPPQVLLSLRAARHGNRTVRYTVDVTAG